MILGLGWADDPNIREEDSEQDGQAQYEGGEVLDQKVGAQPQEEVPNTNDQHRKNPNVVGTK